MCGHEFVGKCVSVDKNGKIIVSGSAHRILFRWDAETGKQMAGAMCGHQDEVTCIAISSSGKIIVSGSRHYVSRAVLGLS